MQGGTVAIELFEKALDLASGPNRGNKLLTVRLEADIVQPSQVQQHAVAKDCIAPTMQSAYGADALAAVSVEDLEDFLLVGWGVGHRRLKHLITAEVLTLHAKRPRDFPRTQKSVE